MDEASFRTPVTLQGRHVRLVPLERGHAPELLRAARDPEVNRYLATRVGPAPADVVRLVDLLLARARDGTDLPFAILRPDDGVAIGMTRFLHIDRENRSVEIGGTWMDARFWRTPVNTEAKLLLLGHAFETEEAHRVWLQTDLRNERSRRAIARLGATLEGVLREDRRLESGYYRSSVVYSILTDEWPRVRARLQAFLAPSGGAPQANRRSTAAE